MFRFASMPATPTIQEEEYYKILVVNKNSSPGMLGKKY